MTESSKPSREEQLEGMVAQLANALKSRNMTEAEHLLVFKASKMIGFKNFKKREDKPK